MSSRIRLAFCAFVSGALLDAVIFEPNPKHIIGFAACFMATILYLFLDRK